MLIIAGCVWTLRANAEGIGLQVGDTAEPGRPDYFDLTFGGVSGESRGFYGVRQTFSPLDTLRLFVDLGMAHVKKGGDDIGLQGGLLYCLPWQPFWSDLGLRVAMFGVNTDARDVMGANLLLLSSGETLMDQLFVYGAIGAEYADIETVELFEEEKDGKRALVQRTTVSTEIKPMATTGAQFRFTESVSLYAEVTWADRLFVGAGLRIR